MEQGTAGHPGRGPCTSVEEVAATGRFSCGIHALFQLMRRSVTAEGFESAPQRKRSNLERSRGHVLPSFRCNAARTARKWHGGEFERNLISTATFLLCSSDVYNPYMKLLLLNGALVVATVLCRGQALKVSYRCTSAAVTKYEQGWNDSIDLAGVTSGHRRHRDRRGCGRWNRHRTFRRR